MLKQDHSWSVINCSIERGGRDNLSARVRRKVEASSDRYEGPVMLRIDKTKELE